jgi:hypothetical protein
VTGDLLRLRSSSVSWRSHTTMTRSVRVTTTALDIPCEGTPPVEDVLRCSHAANRAAFPLAVSVPPLGRRETGRRHRARWMLFRTPTWRRSSHAACYPRPLRYGASPRSVGVDRPALDRQSAFVFARGSCTTTRSATPSIRTIRKSAAPVAMGWRPKRSSSTDLGPRHQTLLCRRLGHRPGRTRVCAICASRRQRARPRRDRERA